MAGEYKRGMVSQLLGGAGKEASEGKMADFFSVPASASDVALTKGTKTEQSPTKKKKKRKAVSTSEEDMEISPRKKKAKKVKVRERPSSEQGDFSPPRLLSLRSSKGFNPPAGIVHEALASPEKISRRKRRMSASDDEDDDLDEERAEKRRKKGIKEDNRPRRDRLKKVNESRTVFVGNVPLTVDKKKLARLFKRFGEIESIRFRCAPVADPTTKKKVAVITKEFHEKRNNISAYVCFQHKEAAKQATELNGLLLEGLHLRVDSAKPAIKDLNKRSVFVGNLRFAIEEETIRKHFEDCGEIENVRVIRDRKTNVGKGFAYILFKSSDSVSLALQLRDSELEKRKVRVQRCSARVQRCSASSASGTDKKERKTNKSDDRSHTTPDAKKRTRKPTIDHRHQKPSRKQRNGNTEHQKMRWKSSTSVSHKDRETGTGTSSTEQKTKRRKKMWQPTNASAAHVHRSRKNAGIDKKKRRSEKQRSRKRSKSDEITRILGPLQQLSLNASAENKAKAKKAKR